MADQPDIGARLRHLGDAVEGAAAPPGPAAARRRAARRRTRRRGAAGLAGAVLAVSGWLLVPAVTAPGGEAPPQARTNYVAATAVLPAPEEDGRLTRASLLGPSALPWHDAYHWRPAGTAAHHGPPTALLGGCALPPPAGNAPDTVTAAYSGRGGAYAEHRIARYGGTDRAAAAMAAFEQALRSCGWHPAAVRHHGNDPRPDAAHEYVLTSAGSTARVTLVRSGERFAVLLVSVGDHADARTRDCLEGSVQDGGDTGCRAATGPGQQGP